MAFIVILRRIRTFTFIEIGVFKGDNAVLMARMAKRLGVIFSYTGFDLFEDNEAFFKEHVEERAKYDTDNSAYWEFKSGGHTLNSVTAKLGQELLYDRFRLIKGDSTRTFAEFDGIARADMIFIDGCHDYDIAVRDWVHAARGFEANSELLVVFDDLTFDGVRKIKEEIQADAQYVVCSLNSNQFYVIKKGPFSEARSWRLISLWMKTKR